MNHPRTIIRKNIVQILKDGNTQAGQKVISDEGRPTEEKSFPCIRVIFQEQTESVDLRVVSTTEEYIRTLPFQIQLFVKGNSGDEINDLIDQFADEVESIMGSNETFKLPDDYEGAVSDSNLLSCQTTIESTGRFLIGEHAMNYNCTYFTYKQRNIIEDALETMHVDYKINSDEVNASETLEVEQ